MIEVVSKIVGWFFGSAFADWIEDSLWPKNSLSRNNTITPGYDRADLPPEMQQAVRSERLTTQTEINPIKY
jgi:hypothetical protein